VAIGIIGHGSSHSTLLPIASVIAQVISRTILKSF
jgi:hypothetical protein